MEAAVPKHVAAQQLPEGEATPLLVLVQRDQQRGHLEDKLLPPDAPAPRAQQGREDRVGERLDARMFALVFVLLSLLLLPVVRGYEHTLFRGRHLVRN